MFCLEIVDRRKKVKGYSLIPSSGIREEVFLAYNMKKKGEK
jgi:hypothetical protein